MTTPWYEPFGITPPSASQTRKIVSHKLESRGPLIGSFMLDHGRIIRQGNPRVLLADEMTKIPHLEVH